MKISNMIDKIKEYWQYVVGAVVAILALGVAASKKRDSKEIVEKGDLELEKEKADKIRTAEREIFQAHEKKRSDAQESYKKKADTIKKIKDARRKELENDSEKLDKILEEKYKLKGD